MVLDLTPIFQKYKGMWVGIIETPRKIKVLGYGKTMEEAEKMAQIRGEKYPILLKVPKEGVLPHRGIHEIQIP